MLKVKTYCVKIKTSKLESQKQLKYLPFLHLRPLQVSTYTL